MKTNSNDMEDVKIIPDSYWSRADAFLLPLTKLRKGKYDMKSWLFWNDYSIENNQLIVTFTYENQEEFDDYLRKVVFPNLDRKGYVLESYEYPTVEGQKRTILILDMSEWGMDISLMLEGRYSKLSSKLRGLVEDFYEGAGERIPVSLYAAMNPRATNIDRLQKFNGGRSMTPLQYVAKKLDVDLADLEKIGEVAGPYDKMSETLITDLSFITSEPEKV